MEELKDGIYRIRIPFDGVFTSVFLLIGDGAVAVFDSAATDEDVEGYILPAIKSLSLPVKYIITSHSHGDHAGGRARLMREYPDAVCVQFFADAPIGEGDMIFSRFQIISMRGHSNDGLALLDTKTKALLSADALQQQGVGKYRTYYASREEYEKDIARIAKMDIDTIICSHDYEPCGAVAEGRAQISAMLDECRKTL